MTCLPWPRGKCLKRDGNEWRVAAREERKKPARKWAGEIRLDSLFLLEYCCGTFALLLLRSIAAGELLKRRREKEMLPRLLPALSSPLLFAKKGEGEEKEGMCDIYREADI